MVWAFGIVFLTLVALFAYWLYANSEQNRQILSRMSRNRRILCGISGSLLSFSSAYLALTVASSSDWNHLSALSLFGTLGFMLLFVALQVGAMLSFVSLASESETKSDQKRS